MRPLRPPLPAPPPTPGDRPIPSLIAISGLAVALTQGAPRQGPDGKTLCEVHCRKCHGATGTPSASMKKLRPELPVWDARFFAQRSDEQIVQVLTNGKGKNISRSGTC